MQMFIIEGYSNNDLTNMNHEVSQISKMMPKAIISKIEQIALEFGFSDDFTAWKRKLIEKKGSKWIR